MRHFPWLLLLVSTIAGAQTLTFNDASVLQAHPKRIGHNVGSLSYYDNSQVFKNLLGTGNPGFEPFSIRQIWPSGDEGTRTTFVSPDSYDPVAEDYWKGAEFSIVQSQRHGAELGCSGTIAGNSRSDFRKGQGVTFTFAAPCAAATAAGDVMIVSKVTDPTPEAVWEGDRSAGSNGLAAVQIPRGGKLTSLTTGLCAACGTQSLVMDATAPGSSSGFTLYYDNLQIANTTPDIYVLHRGTYQLSFEAKITAGSPQLRTSLERLSTSSNRLRCAPFAPKLTGQWAEYTENCEAAEVGIATGDANCVAGGKTTDCTAPGPGMFTVAVTGGAVAFDNLSFRKISGQNPRNPSVFRDEVVDTLVRSGSQVLRFWGSQNGETAWNWTQPDQAMGRAYSGTGFYNEGMGEGISLNDFLVLCETVQKISGKPVVPYIELPVTLEGDDPVNLTEFLDAPAVTKYGARRAALGQTQPWTSVFSEIDLSFCNECWNFAFAGQNLPWRKNATYYGDYSERAHAIFQPIRTRDPYFPPDVIRLGIGFQTATTFQADLAIENVCGPKKDGCPDYAEINAYTSLGMSPPSMDAAWASALVEPYNNIYNPRSQTKVYQSLKDYQNLHACGPKGTSRCEVAVYEENNSTMQSCGTKCTPPARNLTQDEEDELTSGAGQGIVAALEGLLNERAGILSQAFFTLTGVYNGTSNPPDLYAKLWGDVVDMGGATENVRPQFLGVELVNHAIEGEMTDCDFTSGLPTYDYPGDPADNDQPAMDHVPWLYAFCFRSGAERSFVLINTNPLTSYTVGFAGTAAPQGTVKVMQYAPGALNLMNDSRTGSTTYLTAATVALTNSTLSSPASVTVPPHSVTAYSFRAP
ncbi:hypothetical protein [Paracidobacterium acidisoli]|nr:hypothetical protein [Paracidobacterium acidisoli]MBT9332298.1 hypothetical protein [Paracidobacterium acidisoli]